MPIYALGPDEPRIHPSAFVHPDAVVIGAVVIGAEATLWPGAVLRGDHGGRIEVGSRTSIQDGTVLHTTEEWPTIIGSECVVGHNTHLEGCTVEDRCLIGSGSITLNRAVVRTPLCQDQVRQDLILKLCPEGERGVHPYSEFDQRAGA